MKYHERPNSGQPYAGFAEKQMKKAILYVEIEYDESITDDESVANALDHLMDNARSTPGILDEYGNPDVGAFFVLDGSLKSLAAKVDIISKESARMIRNFARNLSGVRDT